MAVQNILVKLMANTNRSALVRWSFHLVLAPFITSTLLLIPL